MSKRVVVIVLTVGAVTVSLGFAPGARAGGLSVGPQGRADDSYLSFRPVTVRASERYATFTVSSRCGSAKAAYTWSDDYYLPSAVVAYRTEDGTAKAGREYAATRGTLVLDRDRPARFTVPLLTGSALDKRRTIKIVLTSTQPEADLWWGLVSGIGGAGAGWCSSIHYGTVFTDESRIDIAPDARG